MSAGVRRGGLQLEIVASLFVVMLAGLAIVAVVMAGLAARTVERATLEQLRSDARHLERAQAVGSLRISDLAAFAWTLAVRSSGARWSVLDAAGREVGGGAHDAPERARLAPLVSAARTGGEALSGGGLYVSDLTLVVALHTSRGEAGFLVGTVPRRVMLEQLVPLLRSGVWALAMASVCFVLFGAYLLRRRIVRPLRALSEATRRLAEGDLGARTADAGSDELAELSRSFNHMAESLARERAALVRASESLARSQRLAAAGQLAAGVAHEVGNPVAAILGYTEVALRGGELSPRSREAAERIRGEALRVRSLVRELLDLARPERAELAPHAPAQLLQGAAQRVRSQPLFERVQLRVDADSDLPPARTDPRRVQQILANLLENAAHALAGQPDARIELRAARTSSKPHPSRRRDDPPDAPFAPPRRPEALALCVIDSGPGIDPEQLPHVFDPFFTTKEPGEGTGLGLWNAHRLAELLGGSLEVESAPGRTCFSLVLPVAGSEADDAPRTHTEGDPDADTEGSHGRAADPDHR